jgi:hypothetical protein
MFFFSCVGFGTFVNLKQPIVLFEQSKTSQDLGIIDTTQNAHKNIYLQSLTVYGTIL